MNIQEKYKDLVNTPSDINEHLPTLYSLAREVDSIVEMGTRDGISTVAFLAAIEGTEKPLTCLDLYKSPVIDEFKVFPNFSFYKSDTLKLLMPDADLLFIDTLHTYYQLFNELTFHSPHTKKYIALHDTTSYAYGDEAFYEETNISIMSENVKKTEKEGLVNAINDFLVTDIGLNWKIDKVYENNNGLTVLKRING